MVCVILKFVTHSNFCYFSKQWFVAPCVYLLCEREILNGKHYNEVPEEAYAAVVGAGCLVLTPIAADSTDLVLASADTSTCLCVLGIAIKNNSFLTF